MRTPDPAAVPAGPGRSGPTPVPPARSAYWLFYREVAAAQLAAWSVHIERRLASTELIAAARAQGWPVLVYTVNQPAAAAALLDAGVAGLFTDDPRALRSALAARK